MLQMMQKKVVEESEKAEELYEKYMCYCRSSDGALSKSISLAEAKIPEVGSSIEASSANKAQLDADVKSHQMDRDAAKAAIAEATAIREKEKAAYDKSFADGETNYAALKKATVAISQGMAGSFLQTSAAATLRAFLGKKQGMLESDRQEIVAFLSGQQGGEYAPASGEIVGILKQMTDEMFKDQEELSATEVEAVRVYEALMSAKKKEVAALSTSIEEKMARVAELGVEIQTMKGDLDDTSAGLTEDKAFLADLEKGCTSKTAIHEEEKKARADELVALADTIKVLNDDDALELFKKTLPSASSSFLQTQVSVAAVRSRAQAILSSVRVRIPHGQGRHRLDFIALALHGKKIGFDKVLALIDELVATLKSEQADDDHKKEYCAVQLDAADDKKKSLERSLADLETVIEDTKEGVDNVAHEIEALKVGIAALDKSVAEATEQRKAEVAGYKELMASNTAAKELLLFAKNRLHKYYSPKLYKPAAKRELSSGDRIFENEGGFIPTAAAGGIAGTGISALLQLASGTHRRQALPPAPEVAAAYAKKSEESGGVLAMLDLLITDLDKDMTAATTEEKDAQEDYAKFMADARDKRAEDSKSLTDKEAARADLESSLEQSGAEKKSEAQELMGAAKYIHSLHAECDWLLQYFDVRKDARAEEVEALGRAKAVLSGADFSLLQRSARGRKFLRRG